MPSPSSPRSIVRWRLGGGLVDVHAALTRALEQPQRTSAAVERSEPAACALAALGTLAAVLNDQDVALEAGYRGVHDALVRLSASTDEDVADAAARAIGVCVAALPAGRGFPLARAPDTLYPPPPYSLTLDSFWAAPAVDAPALATWAGDDVGGTPPPLSVWVRPISAAVRRQQGQADVGHVLWPAAPCFSRWAVAHRCLWAPVPGRTLRTLELGAGLGVAGIVAGLTAAAMWERGGSAGPMPHVTLTDFNPHVLARLRENAGLNDPQLRATGASERAAGGRRSLFGVARLDWSDLGGDAAACDAGGAADERAAADREDGCDAVSGAFDVIIGSDMICCVEDAHGVAAALARFLRRPAPCPEVVRPVGVGAGGVEAPQRPAPPPPLRRPVPDGGLGGGDGGGAPALPRVDTAPLLAAAFAAVDDAGDRAATVAARFRDALAGGPSAASPALSWRATDSPAGCSGADVAGDAVGTGAHSCPPPPVLVPSAPHPLAAVPGLNSALGVAVGLTADAGDVVAAHAGGAAAVSSSGSRGGAAPDGAAGDTDRFAVHGGVGIFLLPRPFTRYGVDAFADALAARGLTGTATTLDAAFAARRFPRGGADDDDFDVTAGGQEEALQLWVVRWRV